MDYIANADRYDKMLYRRCGKSGIKLPVLSLGLWHNFGGVDTFNNCRSIIQKAFDLGITHFDLANNYGPSQTGRRIAPPPLCWLLMPYQFFVMRRPNRRGSVVKMLVVNAVSSEFRKSPVIAVVLNTFFT